VGVPWRRNRIWKLLGEGFEVYWGVSLWVGGEERKRAGRAFSHTNIEDGLWFWFWLELERVGGWMDADVFLASILSIHVNEAQPPHLDEPRPLCVSLCFSTLKGVNTDSSPCYLLETSSVSLSLCGCIFLSSACMIWLANIGNPAPFHQNKNKNQLTSLTLP